MDDKELKTLLTEAFQLIAERKPLPRSLTRRLGPTVTRRLLELVEQLHAEGLAGPHHRTPERLLRMRAIINRWRKPAVEPSTDQIAAALPGQSAVESLELRRSNARTSLDQRRELTELRRRASG